MKSLAMKCAFAALLALAFVGCTDRASSNSSSNEESETWFRRFGTYVKVIEVEGHKYVLLVGCRLGGIVHAESCSCKSGRK